ncbi:MAG TPA: hypothetical protein VF088_05505 [Pyrinomonadaceae bacterium]
MKLKNWLPTVDNLRNFLLTSTTDMLSFFQMLRADPQALANTAKHFAFTRCGELNVYGMVDAQIAVVKDELLANMR